MSLLFYFSAGGPPAKHTTKNIPGSGLIYIFWSAVILSFSFAAVKTKGGLHGRRTAKEKLAYSVYDIVIVGKTDEKLLKEFSKFGEVKKLTQKQIFGY